jgi:FKBP-type peptidyl-prolyl cis-trans isomerase (trigger factor)
VDLVLDEFAKQQGVEPSEDEVERFIEEQAGADDELKGRVDELKRGANTHRYFHSRLRRLRVLERLNEVAGAGSQGQT